MKNFSCFLPCLVLLTLPCLTLGALVRSAEQAPEQVGQLSAVSRGNSPNLRGKWAAKLRKRHAIVALQTSHKTRVHHAKTLHPSEHHPSTGLQAPQKTTIAGQSFLAMHATEATRQRRSKDTRSGACRSKLKWWVKVLKKCRKNFGKDSKWDRDRLNGDCKDAWNNCNTGFYAVCCTQPQGPKNLETYCAKQNMTIDEDHDGDGKKDKACQVQDGMKGVKRVMAGIKDTVKLMDIDPGGTPQIYSLAGPSPGPMMWAPGPAAPPSDLLSSASGKTPPSGLLPATSGSSLAPAPAPAAMVIGPALPTPLETRCEKLKALTREASERIDEVKRWAKKDGIRDDDDGAKEHKHSSAAADVEETIDEDLQEASPENPEAKDPDLVFTVKGVLHVGRKLDLLLKQAKFCGKGKADDDEDDDDGDDEEDLKADLQKDPTATWESDDSSEDEAEDEEDDVLKVNETAIWGLLQWETDMKQAVDKFEEDVHPHGNKWWRYRYEYTMVESIVLASTIIVLYFVMWLLHGVSFFQVHKFYKTGIPDRFYRYAWGYFVFHAASLMVMVTCAYMLYTPWGTGNIFNVCAEAFHGFVDGRANVPFLGESWLYMILDVQLQLFACFAMYSLFIVMVVYNYTSALADWRAHEDVTHVTHEELSQLPRNLRNYKAFLDTFKRRVQNTPAYKDAFKDLRLRLNGVDGLQTNGPGWNDFKLHLYLTDALGKSVEYLVEVSLTTYIFLVISALIVALLAHHYQVAFMYFLPGFLFLGVVLFAAGYFTSLRFRALADDHSHKDPAKFVTVHSFCRAMQICLYCLFFSYSRLLLSFDIFEYYPVVYMVALVSLIIVIILLGVLAGEVIKLTVCALVLPPHLPIEQLSKNLEQVVFWHNTEKCYECGVQQFPSHSSISKEWAGAKSIGERVPVPDSARPFSFRG